MWQECHTIFQSHFRYICPIYDAESDENLISFLFSKQTMQNYSGKTISLSFFYIIIPCKCSSTYLVSGFLKRKKKKKREKNLFYPRDGPRTTRELLIRIILPSARLTDPFSAPSLSGTGSNITKQNLCHYYCKRLTHELYRQSHFLVKCPAGTHVIVLFVLLLLHHGVHVSLIVTHFV